MFEVLNWTYKNFVLSTDQNKLQITRIHRFLSTEAYWCEGIPENVVRKSITGSLCFGLYDQKTNHQIGYARVVTDAATFAWICDIYVEKEFRGQGLSKWMMSCLLEHPSLKGLRRLCLATKDAHTLYQKAGFQVTLSPQNWMEIKDNDLYKKMRESPS